MRLRGGIYPSLTHLWVPFIPDSFETLPEAGSPRRFPAMRFPFFAACLLLGCSSTITVTPPAPDAGGDLDADVDAGADDAAPDVDNGAPSKVYPAFKPVVPQVVAGTGPILTHAVVIPAFFATDALQAKVEALLGKYIPSAHWAEMLAEYGPQSGTLNASVPISDTAPTAIDDTAIKDWLKGKLDGTHPEWPAPTDNTVYMLFYPSTTKITMQGGTSCSSFGGYHGDFAMPAGQKVAYAVLPRCSASASLLTLAVSHELVEAASDPFPTIAPAYAQVDSLHEAWDLTSSGGEIGDMCENDPNAGDTLPDLGFATIQRSWSNAAAAAYHDPCVPEVPNRAYFQSTPVLPDTIAVVIPALPGLGPLGGQTLHVLGVTIPVGKSKTIDVDLWSDSDTGGPWSVSAVDVLAQRNLGAPTLGFAWDRTKGQNGEILHLTITAMSASLLGASPFQVISTNGAQQFTWTGTVGN
jgi:hypothetical protein